MTLKIWLAGLCLAGCASAAAASTFTYASAKLQVGSNGGVGARKVVISFSGTAPAPGNCAFTQIVKSYRDGTNTVQSLKTTGYGIIKNIINDQEKKIPVTYARVCLGSDGVTVTGQYQIYFSDPSLAYGSTFVANNLGYYYAGDLVEVDTYFGGEVPQTYSNYSTVQGNWVITP